MVIKERYKYDKLERITQPDGVRHYVCPRTGKMLPSVTTILSRTADKKELVEWRQRVGDVKAEQIRQEATKLGTLMHTHLECYLLGLPRPGGNNYIRLLAERMANQIIHRGLVHVNECWGTETALYAPHLWAGTTDCVGLYEGKPAIMDFKTAKKIRRREMIEDYFLQLSAYIIAHNELYDTQIDTGVIFMVSRDCEYEEWVIEHGEVSRYKMQFFDRFEQYINHS